MMKKHLLLFIGIAALSSFILQNCTKNTDTHFYQGTFINGFLSTCPNTILITKSIPGGIPVKQSISFFSDINAENGDTLSFHILKYALDTTMHTQECLWGKYVGEIKLK